jgi:type II secretory pathway component PulK
LFPRIDDETFTALSQGRPYNTTREFFDAAQLSEQDFCGDSFLDKPGVKDLTTVFSDGRLNINTAPSQVLAMLPEMTAAAAEAVIGRRSSAPFEKNETLSEELSLLGLTPAQVSSLIKTVKVNSSVFRITARAIAARRHVAQELDIIVKRQEKKFTVLFAGEK